MGSGSFGDLVRAGVPVDRIRELTDGTYAYAAPCPAERVSGMDDLVEFLRAQLDDDERVAKQVMAEPGGFYIEAETADVNIMTIGALVYRWTPKRVLAEVDAKRRMLDMIMSWIDAGYPTLDVGLRLLALPYADRPGYREEWRPV